jgi:hypothetical protein
MEGWIAAGVITNIHIFLLILNNQIQQKADDQWIPGSNQ